MGKIVLWLMVTMSLVASDLNVYMFNPSQLTGQNVFKRMLRSVSGDYVVINVQNGRIVNNRFSASKYKLSKLKKLKKYPEVHLPYALESLYRLILPSDYQHINVYMINAIFYRDGEYDFAKGFPSDAFLTSRVSPFIDLNSFEGFPIKTYIMTHKKYFINDDHFRGLKRFYVLLSERLHLNLQTFNTNFSTNPEAFSVKPLDASKAKSLMSVSLSPPRKLHYDEDERLITHDLGNGTLKGKIVNKLRKNSRITLYLNDEPFVFDCDDAGECRFHMPLFVGRNLFHYKQMDGRAYTHEYNSTYIPDDVVDYKSLTDGEKVTFILKCIHTDRPKGSTVSLHYQEKNKTYTATVDEDGYYEFRIPQTHRLNHFVLKQFNGNQLTITAENPSLKRREEEALRRKIEEAKRAKKIEETRQLVESKRKMEQEGFTPTASIADDKQFKGKHGDPRINLRWEGFEDLDLYVIDPCGNEIDFRHQTKTCHHSTGKLDVDANNGTKVPNPQENIVWEEGGSKGHYQIKVHLFSEKVNVRIPFVLTVVNNGQTFQKHGTVERGNDFSIAFEH
jgi:hypothetical protein